MLKYGRESRHATRQPLSEVCRDLHCRRERYTWTSHPALEGTRCGEHKVWFNRFLKKKVRFYVGLHSKNFFLNDVAVV